ncbi:MAG TPA: FixH family protein [Vicinamibacterales bacterium]|nr:FixH family protein [Vicinamibacterales bacterium]
MTFAVVLPWWAYALAIAAAVALGWLAYARVPIALRRGQRVGLSALRAVTLIVLIVILLRPVVMVPPQAANNSRLPVLIDVSRSMRLHDGEDTARLDRAKAVVRELQARLSQEYRVETLTFGDSLAATTDVERVTASARRSDLRGAIADLFERYRDDRIAGVVVVSDGGDTAPIETTPARDVAAPIFTVGIGSPDAPRDREVVNLTAGEPLLPGASIDISVSATSIGFGTEPVELRLAANGRPLEVRRVTPVSDGAPVHTVFTVSPDPGVATVYSVQIPEASGEIAADNNVRSVLVPPQTGRRRILVVEGAPGYEHTFLKRALSDDPGLDVDAVVRKGQSDDGRDTFYVQADPSRMAALSNGYPSKRSELFVYDAIIFGNIEADFFTRDQLELTAEFISERGGGLLVLGGRSFDRQGLAGTPLEPALPIDLTDRRAEIALASASADQILGGESSEANTPALTRDGATHPATRLAVTPEENRQKWAALPALASVARVGGARPGAQVLAVALTAGGTPQPLIAAQRYGQGRTIAFAGEASWRWRMMRPATDTSYETIWRQMTRWVTAGAQSAVTIMPLSPAAAGATDRISVIVRDEDFRPVASAEVAVVLTAPNGEKRQLAATLSNAGDGRYSVAARFDHGGVYRVDAIASRGGVRVGTAERPVLVGGVDLEMAQPRLNEAVLKRLSAESGGRYLRPDQLSELPSLLRASRAEAGTPEMRDLWHNGWSLAAIIALLAAEWIARRRVGLA